MSDREDAARRLGLLRESHDAFDAFYAAFEHHPASSTMATDIMVRAIRACGAAAAELEAADAPEAAPARKPKICGCADVFDCGQVPCPSAVDDAPEAAAPALRAGEPSAQTRAQWERNVDSHDWSGDGTECARCGLHLAECPWLTPCDDAPEAPTPCRCDGSGVCVGQPWQCPYGCGRAWDGAQWCEATAARPDQAHPFGFDAEGEAGPIMPEEHDGPHCGATHGFKGCVRPVGHAGPHMSRSASSWPNEAMAPSAAPIRCGAFATAVGDSDSHCLLPPGHAGPHDARGEGGEDG